ncbi:MAG: hypothetical protein LUH41_05570 [Clostridiales bacterium]|nr:hypothetical protein [Clostridiales bacterium]
MLWQEQAAGMEQISWAYNPSVTRAKEELQEMYEAMVAEHPDWLEAADYESLTAQLRAEMQVYESDSLTGPDVENSIAPDRAAVQEVSAVKRAILLFLRLFAWGRFTI